MNRTCYLHVGSPKTGSTSIQNWFRANRQVLEKKGILYPGGEKRHQAILSKFLDDPMGTRFHWLNQRTTLEDIRTYDENAVKKMYTDIRNSPAERILISNELFVTKGRHLDFRRLKQHLSGHFDRVVVIGYVRDPLKALVSRSQEQIKSGVRTYEAVAKSPYPIPLEVFDVLLEVFGAENCLIRNFDEIRGAGVNIIEDLVHLIDPELELGPDMEFKQVNASLSLEAALVMSGLNSKYRVYNNKKSRHVRIADLRSIGATGFALPGETIQKVRPQLLAQYAYLNNELGMNFPVPDFDAIKDPQPDWGPETMRQIALVMNMLAERRSSSRSPWIRLGRYLRNKTIRNWG